MGHPPVEKQQLTLAEWIELEQSGDTRYEYHFGEVFAMAGGTLNHSRISRNTTVLLDNFFEDKNKNCESFTSEVKIEISANGRYVYPDTLVVCGDVDESDAVKGAIKNPVIVIEVLSESSAAYDRGVKFKYYKRLRSVKEYLILEQAKMEATLYRRNGDGDLFTRIEYEGPDDVLELLSIGVSVLLSKFYRNVTFPDEA